MAVKYGQQGLDTQLASNRYFDVTEDIFLKHPDQTPFTSLLIQLKKMRSGDAEFAWYDKDLRGVYTTATAISAIASASIVVTDATIFVPGDIIRVVDVTTKALLATHRITAVNTGTNTLTVVRAVSGTDAAIAIGDTLLRIGNAQTEGSSLPEAVQQEMARYYNYTQIVRHSSKYTRTLYESNKFHVGDKNKELQTNREEKRLEHIREIEMINLYGQRAIEAGGTNAVRRYTGGVDFWLAQSAAGGVENRIDVAGAGVITLNGLRSFLVRAFAYGATEKWGFASSEVISMLSFLVKDYVRVKDRETGFGLTVTTFYFTAGTLHLVRHDSMYGIYANALTVIDPAHLTLRYVGDAMSRFKTNVGLASLDAFEDSWLSEVGLQVYIPETLARWGNLQSIA